ncbi:MAG: zinc ribbon domain-containing protein [Oscillospiraceae bacterium]|nr:zinc ribbon domain-containing protein [Oscillospiraceae bacterium]
MKPTYIMKEVHIRPENKENDGLEFVIREGDIILDKGFRFKVLPAAMNFTKPITRKKVPNTPLEKSERLLRIKELREDSAVVAILHQETNYEGTDTLVTIENEHLVTVKYGEEFSVYAKEQLYDAFLPITYEFIIVDESEPKEHKVQNFCTKCGEKLIKGDKFCRECGMPVLK